MRYYVSIAGVPDEFLEFLGYVLVSEDDEFKAYLHKGETCIVKKSAPNLYVDDLNDARILKGNMMTIPGRDQQA